MPTNKYRQKGKRLDAEENKVQAAVDGIRSGLYKNSHVAAESLGLNQTTIYNRLTQRTQERRAAHSGQQLLTPAQEKVLKSWLKWLAATGHPLSKQTIRSKVEELSNHKPSKRWIHRFLTRHTDIVLAGSKGLDPKRAQAFNYHVVMKHFELLQSLIDESGIPIRNLLNEDEVGTQRGGGRNNALQELFFWSEEDRSRYKLKSDELELVTILECVCADGTAPVKPCFVFPGKLFAKDWMTVDPEILLATTETGWTNDDVYIAWFKKCFIPQAKRHADPNFPIILMYNGHGSHNTLPIIELARANNIFLFCLPPHTTHRLQPCNVGAFGPFKSVWQRKLGEYFDQEGEPLRIEDHVRVYMEARAKAFKVDTIKNAWRRSGIDVSGAKPRTTPSIFSFRDFMPSVSSSTTLSLPEGFPIIVNEDRLFVDSESDSESDADTTPGSDTDDDGWQDVATCAHCSNSMVAPSSSLHAMAPPHPSRSRSKSTTSLPPSRSRSESMTAPSSTASRARSKPATAPPDHDNSDLFTSDEDDYSHLSPQELQDKLRKYKAKHNSAQGTISELQLQVETVTAHATFAARHVETLQNQVNARKKRKEGGKARTVNIFAQIATSEEGLAEAQRQDEEKRAKAGENEARAQRKTANQAAVYAACGVGQGNMKFTELLGKLKSQGLRDVCWNLGIDEKGNMDILKARILEHFNVNEQLKQDPHYVALFAKKRRSADLQVDMNQSHRSTTPQLSQSR